MTLQKIALPGVIALAVLVGVAGSSLLNNVLSASADSNTTTGSTTSQTSSAGSSTTGTQPTAPDPSQGGHQANGKTETVLTGDDATKAKAAAQAAEPSATVVRAETDAEGATYEVHMQKSDGSMVTVKLDSSFKTTSTEDGM